MEWTTSLSLGRVTEVKTKRGCSCKWSLPFFIAFTNKTAKALGKLKGTMQQRRQETAFQFFFQVRIPEFGIRIGFFNEFL